MLILLTGCGDTTEENIEGTVENNDGNETNVNKDNDKNKDNNDVNEINQVIVDNENVKATLVKITKISDDTWGNSIEVTFEVENRRNETIEVQARTVSADGRMIDETLLSMSQEVAPEKTATAKLSIMEMEGYDFPELTSDFEMTLHIFSWDNYDYEENHPVNVKF